MQLDAFRTKYNYLQSTPVMQQYLDLKFAHLDSLLLFRMGDFYELFFDDAVLASRALGIALTKRGKIGEEEIPMCGVPYHALQNYLNKLIDSGYNVAICDQLETPEEAKKRGGYKAVVKRGVNRIITPGTIIEESLIESAEPNYLASIVIDKSVASISYADLSTSEILVIDIKESEIINHLARIKPREILLSESLRGGDLANRITNQLCMRITYQVNSFFAVNKCKKIILDFYKIASIQAIGEISEISVSSVGGVIEYISLTQKQNLPQLPFPKIINCNKFIYIDASTRRNLEITSNLSGNIKGSVLDVIDHTITKAGGRLLYKFLSNPLANIEEINNRLKITNFFYSNLLATKSIRQLLKNTDDLARCLTRITMNRGSPRDLLSIKYTISSALEIRSEFLNYFGINSPDYIEEIIKHLSCNEELYSTIDEAIREDAPNSIVEGGVIKHAYHPRVEELAMLIDNGKSCIENLKKLYQKETGIDTLKICHNNVLGLFIEITSRHSSKISDKAKFIHRQTTTNSVRYTTLELQKLESDMVNSRSLMISLESEIYSNICRQLIDKSCFLIALAESLSTLDVFCNFAYIADEYDYSKPELLEDLTFEVVGGRHVVVEKSLSKENRTFVSNDCTLSENKRIWLITGPNMSGKSTFLRQNAIITILAQIGSFVPAKSLRIGVVDKIFSRIGSGDDLLKGQSTFMVEMLETSAILAQSTGKSLIILDEVGRGTSTYDGVSIAWSVLEYIHNTLRSRCLFATHYHELTSMNVDLRGISNYTVAIEELSNNILFLHNIIEGAADKSYGVHVAHMAGLPKSVIMRANEILAKLEKTNALQERDFSKIESNNLNLFDFSETRNNKKYNELKAKFDNIDPDQLTPKEALETLYKLKELVS